MDQLIFEICYITNVHSNVQIWASFAIQHAH